MFKKLFAAGPCTRDLPMVDLIMLIAFRAGYSYTIIALAAFVVLS